MVEYNSEAMNDDALDREVAALLDLEPSPDFVARVRADVSADAIADRWLSGQWAAVAAAAAAVIVGASIFIGTRSVQAPADTAPVVAEHPPVASRIEPREPAVKPPATLPSTAVAAPAAAAAPRNSGVVVSPQESEGLRYLLAALRDGRLDAAAMPSDQGDVVDMPIVIEPITVEPLVAAADLETGAGQ